MRCIKRLTALSVFTLACSVPMLFAETGAKSETQSDAPTGVEIAKERVSGHGESGGNPGRGDMDFDQFINRMGEAVASDKRERIIAVIDEAISSYTSRDEKRENALNYIWLNFFKGRVELAAEKYQRARESFDEANRLYPPGLMGGPWREFNYGMSLSYWKAGERKAFEMGSDFYESTSRHAEFSDPGVMEYKDILFIEERGSAELEEALETYRERGYAEDELDLIRDYHDWISGR